MSHKRIIVAATRRDFGINYQEEKIMFETLLLCGTMLILIGQLLPDENEPEAD